LALKYTELAEEFTQTVSDTVLNHFKIDCQTFFESWKHGIEKDEAN
jgi:hypothetical protein